MCDTILDGVMGFRREMGVGGMRFVVEHAPMPRVRSLFLLNDPFDFANRGGSQVEAIQEWKERYEGVATRLGLAYDRSCVDPSRLMYTPRIPKDAERGEGKHEIIIVDGTPLNLESVERVVTDRKPCATGAVAGMGPGIGSGIGPGIAAFTAMSDRRQFKTPGLLEFAAKHADDFEAAEWAKAMSPEDIRYEQADKIDFRCPNEDGHTNPSPDDRAFMIVNASDSVTGGGFHMGCLHDGCIAASGSDRLWYLDLLCQQFGVAHAMEMEEWCPQAVEKQADADRAKALGADPEGLEAAIGGLCPNSPVTEVDAVLKALATQDAGLAREAALTTIAGKTGQRRTDLAKALRQHAKVSPITVNGVGPGGGGGPRYPVPSDPEDASVIWADWDYMDQIRAVKARLAYLNAKDPTLFCRREGGLVRLKDHEGRMIGSEMDGAGWQSLLSERLEFRKVVAEQERGVEPFKPIVTFMLGNDQTPYPTLDRVAHVPVFGPDGSLRWEKGYDPALRVYVCPNFDPRPVPEEVTAEHVDEAVWWLDEALRDFPFSDTFDGSDDMPVKLDEIDEDGFRLPNMQRGVSSRTNAFAMLLQPFVRSMIDGPCPAYHIDKSSPGSGAGYLVDVAYVIAEGTKAVAQTMSESNEEFRKNITATLREGSSIIFVDNINRRVDSGDLAAALTAGVWRDRILGETRVTTMEIRAMWILAGNNLSFSHELMRRNVPIRLDAAVPNPTRDRGKDDFKHFPLQPWLFENRENLVWACHVLVRNWVQGGMKWGSKILHSFDAWAGVMSGVLEAAGLPGFLDNVDRYLGEKDDDEGTERALAQLCFDKYGMQPMRALDIIAATKGTFGESVIELPLRSNDDNGRARELSGYLKRSMEGRTFEVESKTTQAHGGEAEEVPRERVKLIRRRQKNPVVWGFQPVVG